ncbi:hypothetical protein [Abyssisolibacter fermentans]|uniref:hypothetical protein n=1 Tax=Abyssisolibacter fermentans TaxID=1766203 RepID=UPI00082B0C59|nr:hypothetical protein [Abyssisolibacter fermentans]
MIDFMREELEKEHKPLWKIILIIIFSIIALNYLITLCNKLGDKYAGIASIIVLISSIIICGLLITKLLASHVYVLLQSSLIFEKKIGKKSNTILKIKLKDIEFIKPYKEVEETKNVVSTYKFTCRRNSNKIHYGQFNVDDKKYGLVFQPSDNFLKAIEKKMAIEKKAD